MDLVFSLVVTKTMAQLKTVICFSALVLLCIIPSTLCQLPVLTFVDLLIPIQQYFMAGYVTFLYTENLKTNGEYCLIIIICHHYHCHH
jgi:hypothetical protein